MTQQEAARSKLGSDLDEAIAAARKGGIATRDLADALEQGADNMR
jgi:hypothetical protein